MYPSRLLSICLATTTIAVYATASKVEPFERRVSNDILARMGVRGAGGSTAGELCVELDVSIGDESPAKIVAKLESDWAPATVENFVQYVAAKYYDGTIFHRIIKNFMVQGGAFTDDLYSAGRPTEKSGQRGPINLEAKHPNQRGTLAMARTNDPNSATSQFFINLVDNDFLNPKPGSDGYTVFGRVISGMDVVEQMGSVQTTRIPAGFSDVPTELRKVRLLTASMTPCPSRF